MSGSRLGLKLASLVLVFAAGFLWIRSDRGPFGGDREDDAGLDAELGAIGPVAWLTGCWHHEETGFRREEQWMEPAGGTMLGMSRTVSGGRTVEYEFIRIETRDGSLAFVANPSGQSETTFLQSEISDSVAIFEAPGHDFPQQITYRLFDSQRAVATIEGELDGLTRVIDFPMSRTPCP
jgi:hypothetical protein